MIQIEQLGKREHSKASETYVDVIFRYDAKTELKTSVPIQYRRTGTDIDVCNEKAIEEYLSRIYDEVNPKNWNDWRYEQSEFWKEKAGASVTKSFFDKYNTKSLLSASLDSFFILFLISFTFLHINSFIDYRFYS